MAENRKKSDWRGSPQRGASSWSFHFRKRRLEINLGISSKAGQFREIVKSKKTLAPKPKSEDVLSVTELGDA